MRTVFFVFILSTTFIASIQKHHYPAQQWDKQTHVLINELRHKLNLKKLEWNETLAQLAHKHAENMALNKIPLGHDGFKNRIAEARKTLDLRAAAENVFYASWPATPAQAIQSWKESPGHYQNIINPVYQKTGIGIAQDSLGQTYYTQIFAQ